MTHKLNPLREMGAVILALLAFLSAFGAGISTSIEVLEHGYTPDMHKTSDLMNVLLEVVIVVFAFICAAGSMACAGGIRALREWGIGYKPRVPGRGLIVAGGVLLADIIGAVIVAAINPPQPPSDPHQMSLGIEMVHITVMAALAEEFLVLALPITVARYLMPASLRHRTWVRVVGVLILVAARMSYHLYQGAWSTAHLVWAVSAILLYLWSGRIWPQVIAHFTFDAIASLSEHHIAPTVLTYVLITLIGLACWGAGTVAKRKAPPVLAA